MSNDLIDKVTASPISANPISTEKRNIILIDIPPADSYLLYALKCKEHADNAQKWAESAESPDNQIDADSPTGDTMSAKEWALYAKELALKIGNPVISTTESNGTVTVRKSDGSKNTFTVVKTVNGISASNGNININRKFFNSLAQAGFEYSTVTPKLLAENLLISSTLIFYTTSVTSSDSYAPNLGIIGSYMIIVRKGGSATVPVSFEAIAMDSRTKKLIGNYTNASSYGFSGWSEVVAVKNKGNNYIQYTNGGLYQTGEITVTDITAGGSQNKQVTFSLPFSNTNYKVWFSVANATVDWPYVNIRASSKTTTNMTLNIVNASSVNVDSITFNWFAEVI